MTRNAVGSEIGLRLTVPVAILMAIAAGAGLFAPGLYRDNAGLVAQAIGQDVITLFVALPALTISAYLAGRGSQRARLIWLGLLIYTTYTYASYAFGLRFNPLFLVYVALLGCSTYALVTGLVDTDWAGVRNGFGERTPVKVVSTFLLVMAALFYLMWLSESLPASLAGVAPQSVQEEGTPTNVIHVLDMAWLLPALVIGGISLWRRRPVGYVLGAALLAELAFLALAILAMVVLQARAGEPAPIPVVAIFLALLIGSLGLLFWHLRNLRA